MNNKNEYMKAYREKNKDKILEYNKKYFSVHNPNEKFNCDCGGKYSRANKSKHILSNKHLKFLIKETEKDIV